MIPFVLWTEGTVNPMIKASRLLLTKEVARNLKKSENKQDIFKNINTLTCTGINTPSLREKNKNAESEQESSNHEEFSKMRSHSLNLCRRDD